MRQTFTCFEHDSAVSAAVQQGSPAAPRTDTTCQSAQEGEFSHDV